MKLPKELQEKKKGRQNKKPETVVAPNNKVDLGILISKINKKCRFKGCLYPDKSSCSTPSSIKAHSIQKSTILRSLAENGEVMYFDVRNSFFDKDLSLVGINDASTFFGFCNTHDTKVFSPIENDPYINSKKQNFLFAYRACAFEYAMCKYAVCHSKEMKDLAESPEKKMFYKSKNVKDKTDLNDIKKKLDNFSNELSKDENLIDYDVIYSKSIKIEGNSLLATNSSFSLNYDFDGNQVYNPYDYSIELPTLFLNIFPQNNNTYAIFSCFHNERKSYDEILNKLVKLTEDKLENVLSQMVVVHCGNLFVSPRKWLNINKKRRKLFFSRYMGTMGPIPEKLYLNNSPPLNLFKELRVQEIE